MHVYLSNGHPVPSVLYKWHEKRFPIVEGWVVFTRNVCKCIWICLAVIQTVIQFQLTKLCFIMIMKLFSQARPCSSIDEGWDSCLETFSVFVNYQC